MAALWLASGGSPTYYRAMARQFLIGRSNLPPADYVAETRELYDSLGYDSYRWAERSEPVPLAQLPASLADAKVMIIGSGGVYRHGQVAFSTKDDTSIRLIAADTPADELRTAHFAYDQTDARSDINCVFPLQRLRELAANGFIGSLSELHCAFMGGIYSTRRLLSETVPRLLEQCRANKPDLVLLVPV